MEKGNSFLTLFKNSKPIIGMIHLKGNNDKEVFERAISEIDILLDNGVEGIMVENYFGTTAQVIMILEYINNYLANTIYGLNILGDTVGAFRIAREYGAKFIQLDSVSGHLNSENDKKFNDFLVEEREKTDSYILGGVRFKYQPYLSGRSLEEDLKIGMKRCDAICVTGSGTGKETDFEKMKVFRKHIGDFPLLVCAGLTVDNCFSQLEIADGGVVGSYFKDTFKDSGDVCKQHVLDFMSIVSKLRNKQIEKNFA